MNKFIITLSLVFLLGGIFSTSAKAADVVVVNVKKIVNESVAAKGIAKHVSETRNKFQEEVSKEEENLRKEDQELSKQRNILSKEAFEQRAKEFRTRLIDAQKMVQARRSTLEKAYVEALKKVREKTLEIVADLAKERDFSIAIPKSHLLYSKDTLDISNDVLERLNKTLTKVKVEIKDSKPAK